MKEKDTIEYSNGDYYDGEIFDDEPSGKGKMIYASGDTYEGDWAGVKDTAKVNKPIKMVIYSLVIGVMMKSVDLELTLMQVVMFTLVIMICLAQRVKEKLFIKMAIVTKVTGQMESMMVRVNILMQVVTVLLADGKKENQLAKEPIII